MTRTAGKAQLLEKILTEEKLKKYTLTEEHKAQLPAWRDKWIANAMSTKPMDDHDRAETRKAIRGLYEAADLTPPPDHRIVFVASPFIMKFAGGFAASIWWLRKNKKTTAAATYGATDAATRAATYGATDAATAAATRDATYDATYAATDAATDAATYGATDDATRAATAAATDAATYAGVEVAANENWYSFAVRQMVSLSNALGLAEFGLGCAANAYSLWQGGNQWSAWVSFLSFFRHVAKLSIDYSKFDHYEKATIHSGPRIMHAEFCIVSDRPEILLVDNRNRPHCDTGPFCKWRDGSALFAIDGIRTPEWVVMTPVEKLDPRRILKIENVDVRRIAIKKIGVAKMISALGAKVIDSKKFDVGGKYNLLSIDYTGSMRIYLEMKNPSIDDTHIEAVHPLCETVDQALGFRRYGMTNLEWQKKGYKYAAPKIIS